MHESLKLFDDIINSKWFSDTPVVLFLNKSDLFKNKIKKYKISDYFPEYTGGDDFREACDFISVCFFFVLQIIWCCFSLFLIILGLLGNFSLFSLLLQRF